MADERRRRSTRGAGDDPLDRLFRSGEGNAVLAWLLIVAIPIVLVESVVDTDLQSMVFVTVAAVVVLVPPIHARTWRVMLPWEVIAIALLPILVRASVGGEVGTFATYLAVAGLALIATVELDLFTALEVTHWFAVTLVVLTTLAAVALWTVVRWQLDRFAGTNYLTTNEALMGEWLWVAGAGLAAGVLFDAYFRRRDRQLRQLIMRRVAG